MNDHEIQSDDDIQSQLTRGHPDYFDMDDAFWRAAIAAGLESASIGVVTTPGTKNPRYIATKQPMALSQADGPLI